MKPHDITLPYPPPRRVDPNATLPPAMTDVVLASVDEPAQDPVYRAFVGRQLDDHFASRAETRMRFCLDGCRYVLEHGRQGHPGADELSFNLARVAAHWRSIADDQRRGDVLVVAELEE